MSINHKIARASIILIIVSIFGHALSLLKEMFVASFFGIGRQMDAYYAAMTLPNLVTNILISTFIASFIPVFVRYKQEEQETHLRTASIVVNYITLFMAGISIVFYAFAPVIIHICFHGLAPDTVILASKILRIVSITIVFSSLIGVLGAVLNTYESFKWPALLQMSVTISTMALLMLFGSKIGVYVLAAGLVAGVIFQLGALLILAYGKGYRYTSSLDSSSPSVREIFSAVAVLFLAVISTQVNMLVDRVMASWLQEGSLAALGYADKLVQVPLIVFSGSIATAAFPYFSRQAAENKFEELSDSIAKSIRMTAFIFIPITVMLSIIAKPLITVLFQRGAFTAQATELTSAIFICYSFQFFFFTVTAIFHRAILALRYNAIFLKVALFSILLNIALNFLFIRFMHPAVAGIALSTSVVQMVTCVLLSLMLPKMNVRLDWKYIYGGITKILFSSFVAGLTLILAFRWYSCKTPWHTLPGNAVGIILVLTAGSMVFVMFSYIMRLEEVKKISEAICSFNKI